MEQSVPFYVSAYEWSNSLVYHIFEGFCLESTSLVKIFGNGTGNCQVKHAQCFSNELNFVSRSSRAWYFAFIVDRVSFFFCFFICTPEPLDYRNSCCRERNLDNFDSLFDVKRAALPRSDSPRSSLFIFLSMLSWKCSFFPSFFFVAFHSNRGAKNNWWRTWLATAARQCDRMQMELVQRRKLGKVGGKTWNCMFSAILCQNENKHFGV